MTMCDTPEKDRDQDRDRDSEPEILILVEIRVDRSTKTFVYQRFSQTRKRFWDRLWGKSK